MDNYKEYLDPADGYALVKQSVNMPVHPDWIEIPDGAEFYMQMRVGLKVGCKFFFKFDDEDLRVLYGSGWQHTSYDSIQEYIDEGDQLLWSREAVKKDPALISGADALRALADGNSVECQNKSTFEWFNCLSLSVAELVEGSCKYRIKPQTVKLELELPKPFEPEEGEKYWWINPNAKLGYEWDTNDLERTDFNRIAMSVWRTEEEIKQVVEQLRKIRGTNS
ncbi:hypothetical protein [Acinetobacter baumannii]|uniref:hypothetical protein n=1 Tax=Acinetobacter baumannii TaxID=470 RepID=UPI0022B2D069|nr:hypothetical protein [Acinetobacter baumannii]MCZ6923877.1 hypothetical protein [Acinetobacter baumannii]